MLFCAGKHSKRPDVYKCAGIGKRGTALSAGDGGAGQGARVHEARVAGLRKRSFMAQARKESWTEQASLPWKTTYRVAG